MDLDSALKFILNPLTGFDPLEELKEIFDPLGFGEKAFEKADQKSKQELKRNVIDAYTFFSMDFDGKTIVLITMYIVKL